MNAAPRKKIDCNTFDLMPSKGKPEIVRQEHRQTRNTVDVLAEEYSVFLRRRKSPDPSIMENRIEQQCLHWKQSVYDALGEAMGDCE